MEHGHDGANGWRAEVEAGAVGATPAILGAAGTVLDGPPAGAVGSSGGPSLESPAVAATASAGAAGLASVLARALDVGGLDKLTEWLFALSPLALAGAVVDTLRDAGELPATVARLDAGELDAGAVVDRVAFGSLARLYALADRAMGPLPCPHCEGGADD